MKKKYKSMGPGRRSHKVANIHHLTNIIIYLNNVPEANQSQITRGAVVSSGYVKSAIKWLLFHKIILLKEEKGQRRANLYSLNPFFKTKCK